MKQLTLRPLAWSLALIGTLTLAACGGGGGGGGDSGNSNATTPVTSELAAPTLSFIAPGESLDLANYTLVGKYNLPVGSGSNLLASEVSAITWNKDTDTLFIVGDNGTSVTQIGKTGALIDTMTLPADATKPQGTYYYDTEGIAYLGGGQFVMVEERYRQATRFTYTGGTTLDPANAKTVKLGTTIGNVGLEGVSYDPVSNGFIFVKEKTPLGIFQSGIDFAAGTATNGSPTTTDSSNLFSPALADNVADFGDISVLANVLPASAADREHLIVLSQESGRLLKMDRAGKIYSKLGIEVAAQHEGVTFDADLNMYVTNELGSGGTSGEQLWVYTPTRAATAVGVGSNLYLNFGSVITAGSGSIELDNGAGDKRSIAITDSTQISFSNSSVVINPATDLKPGSTYTVRFAAGLVKDAGGKANGAGSLSFTTVNDITVPQLVSATPGDDALNVTGSRVVLSFNEAVAAGSGNFTLSNGSDDVRVIKASDITQVTISGNTVDINPSADLRPGSAYHLLVDGTALTDLAGNPFVGWNVTTRLNFTTAASSIPTTLAAGDILFVGANADATDAFAFILMKGINAGTTIFFSDRDSLAATNESAFQWVADKAYPAATIVTIQTDAQPLIADKGSVLGKDGGISTSSETIFAFQGSIDGLAAGAAGSLTVDRYLAAINIGGAAGPMDVTLQTALAPASAYISLLIDNARYSGALSASDLAALRALVANPANWASSDTVAFPLTNNSLF
ncbi:SdiA-regulated domain-containing protein [Uliginosibacterium sp. 31-16]|uniref:SdiA-regulated domain-containing protein n=1 Tax=Uliginosibacterium sp. 31-16 TaxID=3068315 RepID=UPI00273DB5EB|nr:SdiA-regulated domain-containing protein [Uliginosibacterium sp. 31-16]MDP5239663.1 SdiA-regulated domain-containing protein [Uliginosibacterium sp. 31-16]